MGGLKPFSLIFFVAVMVWVGSIMLTTKPEARMDRGCFPVELVDRTLTSGVMVVNASWAPGAHDLFQGWTNACKFMVWKIFYEGDWLAQQGLQAPPGGLGTPQDALRLQQQASTQDRTPLAPSKVASSTKAGFANSNESAQKQLDRATRGEDPAGRSVGGEQAAEDARQKLGTGGAAALAGKSAQPASYFEPGR